MPYFEQARTSGNQFNSLNNGGLQQFLGASKANHVEMRVVGRFFPMNPADIEIQYNAEWRLFDIIHSRAGLLHSLSNPVYAAQIKKELCMRIQLVKEV